MLMGRSKNRALHSIASTGSKSVPLISLPVMDTAVFSAASLFHGDDSDDDRDKKQVDAEGQKQALEYVERAHDFPGMLMIIFFNLPVFPLIILSGTGALAIFLRKSFGVDITTSDYDDKEIEENIAYNCRANNLDVLPHIRRESSYHPKQKKYTWGDPFPVSRPDWDIVIASDILLYVKQYENLVKTLSFLLKEYKQNGQKTGNTNTCENSNVSDELA
ncbi:hypothetical protein PR202_gb10402 [Eleusine coracana subsp. coracana]|uniref:Uncharacterized protein n=1 Tax=Eleusine coracana subsp. coracana TaxID=191504 RepID=A0AAV5EJ75_ELECO|nr:hypothetical protein PR202_gb10402 [Eleusine coracana subsp. coracana]